MTKGFNGFSKDLFDFLRELAKNNNREWFDANKDRYRNVVVSPVCQFIEQFAPVLAKISDSIIADPRPHGGSMFRIYRDTRFSKDKTPYKQHVGCHFRHMAGKDAHAPGFYFHLEPGKVLVGGGIWQPPNSTLDQIRHYMVDNPATWKKIVNSKKIKSQYGGLRGDGLIRPPRGYDADHPLIEDLKRKSFFVINEMTEEDALSPKFVKQVEKTYKDISPMMEYITEAVGLVFNRIS